MVLPEEKRMERRLDQDCMRYDELDVITRLSRFLNEETAPYIKIYEYYQEMKRRRYLTDDTLRSHAVNAFCLIPTEVLSAKSLKRYQTLAETYFPQ